MRHVVLSILFSLLSLNAALGAAPVPVGEADSKINVTASLSMLEDGSQAMSLDEVLKSPLPWRDNALSYINLGYSPSAYWFRVSFESSLEDARLFFLEVAFPSLDHVDLHVSDRAGGWRTLKGGNSLPYDERVIRHRNHLFPIIMLKGTQTCYLRVQSSGTVEFHANLLSPSALLETAVKESGFIWLIYGCILMAGLYNACVFVITRDKTYLHLVCYGATFLAIDFIHQGHLQQYVLPGFAWPARHAMIIALSMNLYFAGAFVASYLETRRRHPAIHRMIFWFFLVPGLAYLPLSLAVESGALVQVVIRHLLCACLVVMGILLYLSVKRERPAIFLAAGYCFILASGVFTVLVFTGNLAPGIVSKWFIPVGAAWLMLAFSIGLADKINVMKRRLERSDEKIREKNLELMDANSLLQSINTAMEERNAELTALHEALEISEHRLWSMIEQSPLVIELYDHQGALIQTNKVRKDTWGGYGAVSGSEFNVIGSEAMKKLPIYPTILRVFQGKGTFVEEWSLDAGDGREEENRRYYRSRLYPIFTASGKLSNVVIMHEDITKDKRAEEILIQSEKMVCLGGLAAGMAHEINSPLAGMVQNAQVLVLRLTKPLPANLEAAARVGVSLDGVLRYMADREVPRILESIREAGNRTAETVRNMLSFSRQDGSAAVKCDLRELLRQTLNLARNDYDLKQRFNFRNLTVREDFDPDTPDALCEPSKIQQVFLNILKNGAQAMGAQPFQEDADYHFRLRIRPEGDHVAVEIEDNGPGMDQDTLEHVFEPFYTTKKPGEGTGLGLFLCWHIIGEVHGGTLRVESEPGKGARFIMTLPVEGKPSALTQA